MATVIIVEGKHDRERLLEVIRADIAIVCTFGIPTQARLNELNQQSEDADQVFIFTDNDRAGKRIRGILRDEVSRGDSFTHENRVWRGRKDAARVSAPTS